MRVGSGGVMLPNHAPLMVAERFKVLEALFPGRIDLGLGRAPGTDQITSLALRRRQDVRDDDDFLERFQELLLFETRGFPDGPSVPQGARDADRRPAAADLAARLERLQRRACRACRGGIFLRASFREPRSRSPHAELSRAVQAVAGAGEAPRDPRASPRSRPTPTRKPTALPPPSTSISCAARRANTCRSPSPEEAAAYRLLADRPRAHPAQPRAPVRRLARDRAGEPSSR